MNRVVDNVYLQIKKVQEIANIYDIMGIVGNGASYSVQMDAGIEDTDLIISVTESDELNLLCCTVAKQVGDCAAIARVRTPDYSKEAGYLREKLGLAMIINPELEAAREAARILFLPSAYIFLLVILYYSREMLFLLLLPAKLQENSFLILDLRQSR